MAALATGRPEPLVLATPFLVIVAVGLAVAPPAELRAELRLVADRVGHGEGAVLVVTVGGTAGATVALQLDLPPGIEAEGGAVRLVALGDGHAELRVALTAPQWGSFEVGGASIRLEDRFGLLAVSGRTRSSAVLRVYPPPEALRRLVQPRDTTLVAGVHVSRAKGPGLEFAELRPYRAGDRTRDVNWRATARRGEVWVNERHPERSVDVVVLLDAFSQAELPRAVAAADAVVRAHLAGRDRVGLISFGGAMRWLRPGSGLRQQYLIVEALLDSRVFASVVWRDLAQVPRRALPPTALVVAVSPLLDPRAMAAIADLDQRGVDLAVLAVAPVAGPAADRAGALAGRLGRLRWDAEVEAFRARGIPAVAWRDGDRLGEAVEELARWPRTRASAR